MSRLIVCVQTTIAPDASTISLLSFVRPSSSVLALLLFACLGQTHTASALSVREVHTHLVELRLLLALLSFQHPREARGEVCSFGLARERTTRHSPRLREERV